MAQSEVVKQEEIVGFRCLAAAEAIAEMALPRFRPRPPWLGPDLQTIRNSLMPTPRLPGHFTGTELQFPLAEKAAGALVGTLNTPIGGHSKPLVIVLHGLTGCQDSVHAVSTARHLLNLGYSVLRLNFRGSGPSAATSAGSYHAGLTQDLVDVVSGLPDAVSAKGVLLVGYSLGGNALLKFLAEGRALEAVLGAAAVSAPIDLKRCQLRMEAPRNRLYHRYLVRRMRRMAEAMSEHIPWLTPARVAAIESIYDFDNRIVARLHGFDNAEHYYREASAGPRASAIETPTLIVHADDDPWIPAEVYEATSWARGGPVHPVLTRGGGHVGFHGRGSAQTWHDRAVAAFFSWVTEKNMVTVH